ncbi:molybdopterin guanine dinucleotide synthesis [Thalassococcus lentus]|uniref:Molybdopterin guanine dinucleotide synthesis n=1 Tax=Thalassococcus lentus TaxID=1210524 RepID=A0ABT4XSQ9_9RHOB|nr:molybdopterin guanine dinucleotide synthesis [Thalassococcus lentus]MDA7424981.1 molybdopterin guanine dinucleotide synthesis [Thalassococcus lentus]
MVDWSGGNDTGPRPRKDAIWMAVSDHGLDAAPLYLRNRQVAEAAIGELIAHSLSEGQRLMIGFDFPFGYPAGFAQQVTGSDDPLVLWEWLDAHIEDHPKGNNRFSLAGQINARFPGIGPFWFNATKSDVPGLPRKDTRQGHGMTERREADRAAKGTFTCWQLGGAGAVGSQVLMGLPVLSRLRKRFAGQIAVWPFESLDRPVAFVEIWPSLLAQSVRERQARTGAIRDAVQVEVVAQALHALDPARLSAMLNVDAPQEGWILGLGFEEELEAACL